MKTANSFEEVTLHNLPKRVVSNEYINAFADKMMLLSNRLNEVSEEVSDNPDNCRDDYDIMQDYLPAIREFIANITGL